MKSNGHLDSGTRERILEASGEIFAEGGFRGATVRKICDRAGVNVSAIKYHFGGKEELYAEVLRHWHEFAIRKYPPLLGVGENASPEEQLRAFIGSLLFRMLDKGKPAWFGKLMAREMGEPTKAFEDMVKEVMRPLNKLLASIVERIVGTHVGEESIRLCCASIFGQCVYYYNARYIAQLSRRDLSRPKEIEGIADHITRFSLRGLECYVKHDEVRMKKESKGQKGH